MATSVDVTNFLEELVDAHRWGDEPRARALIAQLQERPREARALLEIMLASPDALVRQAGAFGLGELGGAASAKRLEQQLAIEEARRDYDGASVTGAITEALGRIDDTDARMSLVRRLNRLVDKNPSPSDVNALARALWRRRHPELRPAVEQAIERLPLPVAGTLRGLRMLLEKSPEALRAWAADPEVPVEEKTEVLTVMEEDVPDVLLAVLAAFISSASSLTTSAVAQRGAASYYCERLFILLLLHEEHLLQVLPADSQATLRALARSLVAASSLNCSLRAANLLARMGLPEDAALIEAHRPEEPIAAKAFDEAAQALRRRGPPSMNQT